MFLYFNTKEIAQFDYQMSQFFGDNKVIGLFHYLGETKFIIFITLILIVYLWFRSKNYRGMLFVVLSIGFGNVLNQMLKKWVERERPDVPQQLETFSFPSGHAMVGLLCLFTIAYFLTEHQSSKLNRILIWIVTIFISVMVGLSRIAEHRHFASDVLAGWMIGYSWFVIVALWYEYRNRVFKKHTQ
nr:phosphatase PAP2 family protein [Psychrobacillus psychrodurans]